MGAKAGSYLRNKRNFLLFSVIAIGLPNIALLETYLGHYSNFAFQLLLFVAAIGGGLLWGLLMWEYFKWKYPSLRNENECIKNAKKKDTEGKD